MGKLQYKQCEGRRSRNLYSNDQEAQTATSNVYATPVTSVANVALFMAIYSILAASVYDICIPGLYRFLKCLKVLEIQSCFFQDLEKHYFFRYGALKSLNFLFWQIIQSLTELCKYFSEIIIAWVQIFTPSYVKIAINENRIVLEKL